MQQATRIADRTAFMYMGRLVEYGETSQIFTNPTEKKRKPTLRAVSAKAHSKPFSS